MGLQGRRLRPRSISLSYAARELAIQRDLERLAEERAGESEALTRSESRQGVTRVPLNTAYIFRLAVPEHSAFRRHSSCAKLHLQDVRWRILRRLAL